MGFRAPVVTSVTPPAIRPHLSSSSLGTPATPTRDEPPSRRSSTHELLASGTTTATPNAASTGSRASLAARLPPLSTTSGTPQPAAAASGNSHELPRLRPASIELASRLGTYPSPLCSTDCLRSRSPLGTRGWVTTEAQESLVDDLRVTAAAIQSASVDRDMTLDKLAERVRKVEREHLGLNKLIGPFYSSAVHPDECQESHLSDLLCGVMVGLERQV